MIAQLNFMPHQKGVLQATEPFNRVAYYLDMGLGKTFVGAEKLWQLNNAVNLVICQKSKIDDWLQHFNDYYPDVKVFDLSKKSDALIYQKTINNDADDAETVIGVINYDLIFRRSYISHMTDFTLMLDESSLICNENAKRSKFILKLSPESVILLSGTPTAGKYERLWSQCQLLGWKISKKTFWSSYIETKWIDIGNFKQEIVTGYKNVEHLKKKLAEYGAIFMKTEEVIELPKQIEQNVFFENTKEYRYFMKNDYLLLNQDTELIGDNSLTKMLYARQLCGQYHSEKLQGLRDLIESSDDRWIIFYNFTEELNRMREHLQDLDRSFSVLNGSVKDMTAYENISDSITFIQYQAGAMGGNYQKANRIIYYTLPLGKGSCDMWEQSKKRIHRIGQNRPCFYYYLLVKGSIEEKNFAALKLGKDYTDELFTKS